MRDVWTICRIKLRASFRRKNRLSSVLWILLGVLYVASAALMEGAILFLLMEVRAESLYPMLVLVVSALFALVTTVQLTESYLISARDHDLMASLPVSSISVACSRLLGLYCMNGLYQLMILLPAGVLWAVFMRPAAWFYAIYPVLMLTAPLVPVALGGLLGLTVVRIGTWFKSTRAISLIISAAGLLTYMAVFFLIDLEQVDWLRIGALLEKWITCIYPPTALFSGAMLSGSWAQMALFAAISIAAVTVFSWLYARNYLRLYTMMTARRSGERFEIKRQGRRQVMTALVQREFRRYFACNAYVLNTGFGLLLSVLILVILKFKTPEFVFTLMGLPFLRDMVQLIMPFAVAFLVGTCSTTSCSVSLEGKSMWVLRALPVSARQIAAAKVLMNLLTGLPFVVADGMLMLTIVPVDALTAALMFLAPVLVLLFSALLGILFDLRFCKLDWDSEAKVVKQSLSAVLTPLVSILLCTAPILLSVYLGMQGTSVAWLAWAFTLLVGALDVVLAAIVYAKADRMLANIK